MGENEQGGMLRTVVILGLIALIAAVVTGGVISLSAHMKTTSNKVSDNIQKNIKDVDGPGYDVITDDYQTSNHYYDFNSSNKTAVINSVKGSTHDVGLVTVPSFVKDAGVRYTVVGIGNFAYANAPGMTGVIIPDSIKKIDDYAFYGSPITTVDFGKGIVSIGKESFERTNLTSVIVPDNVKTIGNQAFDQIPGNKDGFVSIGKNTTYVTDGWKSSFGGTYLGGNFVPYKPLIRN